jgi:hypothetical protein
VPKPITYKTILQNPHDYYVNIRKPLSMEHGQIQTIVPILLSIRNPGSLHMHLNKHNVALQEMFFEIFTKLGIVDKNYLLYSNKFVV